MTDPLPCASQGGDLAPLRCLIDAKEVGRVLGCSWRHVMRLADQGVLPWGYKLGALRRWDLSEIEAFIAAGCKPIRKEAGR
jgi:predicted DNA-binding transcriptional regulator AlpA